MYKYTFDEYKSRIELSKKMFHQIEKLVNELLDYIPLDINHLAIYSLKVVTIILEIGPEIINSFDLAVFYIGQGSILEVFDNTIHKQREILLKKRSRN